MKDVGGRGLHNKPSGLTAIVTVSGFVFDLMQPDATGLPVEDVAWALACQPRWGGAAKPVYSVAEHSVFVSWLVRPALAYSGLWHDCSEFLTGDNPSPYKVFLGREFLKEKLAPVEAALAAWFGYETNHPEVKVADLIAQATELRDLLPPHWMEWGHLPPPALERIVPVGPELAYAMFMDRHNALRHLALPPAGALRAG